jgi:hypothetical protein
MNSTLGIGIALSVLGLLGYAAGVWTPYPGRAFSVTAVMVGLTLVAIGRAGSSNESEDVGPGEGSRTATERREGAS